MLTGGYLTRGANNVALVTRSLAPFRSFPLCTQYYCYVIRIPASFTFLTEMMGIASWYVMNVAKVLTLSRIWALDKVAASVEQEISGVWPGARPRTDSI